MAHRILHYQKGLILVPIIPAVSHLMVYSCPLHKTQCGLVAFGDSSVIMYVQQHLVNFSDKDI